MAGSLYSANGGDGASPRAQIRQLNGAKMSATAAGHRAGLAAERQYCRAAAQVYSKSVLGNARSAFDLLPGYAGLRYAGPPSRAGISKAADSGTDSERVIRSPM